MKNFLAGFGLGWALGILLAPLSGKELRNNISDSARDVADTARKRYGQVRDAAGKPAQSIRRDAEQESGEQASL